MPQLPTLNPSDIVIAAAIALQIAGLLLRHQIALRLFVMAGSVCYVVYYYIVADSPLWAAMAGSGLLILANVVGLATLLLGRSIYAVRRDQRHILAAMAPMEPGAFRGLISLGEVRHIMTETPLTEEAATPAFLHFVVSGRCALSRGDGPMYELSGPCFIGEVAWMLDAPASATVTALPGAEIVVWPIADLHRLTRRHPRLATALEAVVARDMARKVARSLPDLKTIMVRAA